MDRANLADRHFHRCLEDAGLKRRGYHDLRHTFASLLLTAGAPIAYVSEQMEHSSIELTVKRYGYLISGANRSFINSLPGVKSNVQNLHPIRTQEERASSMGDSGFPVSDLDSLAWVGAGDGDRNRDVQLGNSILYVDYKGFT
jgi:hypothetical protein